MSKPTNYREVGENHLQAAWVATQEAEREVMAPIQLVSHTEATNHLLMAIYHELRHANDQAAAAAAKLAAEIKEVEAAVTAIR